MEPLTKNRKRDIARKKISQTKTRIYLKAREGKQNLQENDAYEIYDHIGKWIAVAIMMALYFLFG